jgi:hypothetical protein
MLSGHRSAWRRRGRNSRAARIAVPLAIPMALGLTLGVVLAVSGNNHTTISQAAGDASASPSASPDASPTASGSTAADPPAAVVPPAATFANGPVATRQLGDLATTPVDGTGAAITLNQTSAQAATSMNCTLTVPNRPLTARGLATPWQLGDGCSQANAGTEGAFVEATILSPNGQLQIYDPLVVTAGTTPAVAPTPPTIAAGSHVIIDVGFNGSNLVLEGRGARQGNCVDALGQSVIGQVSACNAVNFYRAANAEIANGTLTVPPIGTSKDGQPCETVRNFALVDQDQSDNVVTTYLINANGQTAQDTAANASSLGGAATPIGNGSDDRLLADFVDPANGCTAFSATNTTNAGGTSGAQALNELSARVNQTGTIAVVPVNDEMTLVGGAFSIAKTNVYRSLVDQPLLAGNVDPNQVAADYCQNMVNIAPAHNQLDAANETGPSPVPATGNTLATFLAARLSASFGVLGCANFGLTNPVTLQTDTNGVAIGDTYNLAQQTAGAGGTGTSGAGGTSTSPAASPTTTAPADPPGSNGPGGNGYRHRRGHWHR